jgi:CTP synthase (UTP-ammonia lyase)
VGTDTDRARDLGEADAVWLLPGTPYRNDGAAHAAIRHCLDTDTPFLGTCGGFQYACVELARSRAGLAAADSAELSPDGEELVVVPLACTLYGERRTVTPVLGTRLADVCGDAPFDGYHHCGYGLADEYVSRLQAGGVVVCAHAPDAGVEGIELPEHPFFLATAFQPQVGSGASGVLHPLLTALLDAARARTCLRA